MGSRQRDTLYFDRLGDDFDCFMSEYDVKRRAFLISREIERVGGVRGKSVLEIGCGTGRISELLAGLGCRLTVNDISPRLTAEVSAAVGCKGVAGDCLCLPLADECFDAIVSSECIEHTESPYAAVGEMHRVLRRGGRLFLTTPNRLWYPLLWVAETVGVRRFRGIEHWTWPWRTRELLRSLGFQSLRFSGCHLLPWQLPLAKHWLPFADRAAETLYPVMVNYLATGIKANEATARGLRRVRSRSCQQALLHGGQAVAEEMHAGLLERVD